MGILFSLFIAFAKIGAFSFGGGYAMIPLIEREIVITHGWMTWTELLDITAISQATPGPVAVNAATFVGYKLAGLAGSVAATSGVVSPPAVITLVLAWLFFKYRNVSLVNDFFRGVRPIVVALIVAAGVGVWRESVVDWQAALLALGTFLVVLFSKLHPIIILGVSAFLGVVIYTT